MVRLADVLLAESDEVRSMRPLREISILGLAFLVGSPFVNRTLPAPAPGVGNPARVTCAFSNPRYSGWCRVTEDVPDTSTPEGVCQTVLSCLNTVSCTKTYCSATEVRSGWRLEKVEAESSALSDSDGRPIMSDLI